MELQSKVALVTGGSRMGAEIGRSLASKGCSVALTWKHSREPAEQAVRAFGAHGLFLRANLEKEKEVRRLMRTLREKFGGLDILVHMVSDYEKTPFNHLTSDAWQKHVNTDLKSAYLVAAMAASLMKKRSEGRILFVSDWTAASGRPRYKNHVPYYTAKKGILGLTESLALELAPKILVNCIAPGPILPPKNTTPLQNRKVLEQTPLKRWGGPQELAKAVMFFLESDFVTGECLRVDGGRHLY